MTDVPRCKWVTKDSIYIQYHDEEWGKPEYDKLKLFEMICLEGQQAGLSWITILKKRDNYRKVFFDFDPSRIIEIKDCDILNILNNSSIVRHKGKIESIINNAKCYIEMEKNGEDFSDFIWSFVDSKPIINDWRNDGEVPTQTSQSISLSKALKKRGFKFVGATTCYSFMQACGLVNDHHQNCVCYKQYDK